MPVLLVDQINECRSRGAWEAAGNGKIWYTFAVSYMDPLEMYILRTVWQMHVHADAACLTFNMWYENVLNALHGRLWALVDFTGSAWYYPALQLLRKMYLTMQGL